jgi:hypothetical protein
MTVKYLRSLQRTKQLVPSQNLQQSLPITQIGDSYGKYRLGYNDCVQECYKFIGNQANSNDLDSLTRQRMFASLANRFQTQQQQQLQQQQQVSYESPIDTDDSQRGLSISPVSAHDTSSSDSSTFSPPSPNSIYIKSEATTENDSNLNEDDKDPNMWRPW